ncbi:DNA-binding protein [Methylobacterium indicum]|uniref:DUF3140 domain-containing protein n=1 Tax=Methylobacterium indicum TaxID=1775910 RepID=UPI000734EB84|nr:DUF3140 domain-containing protein [Methylobacterium indicum]KTS12101.1 DNA-binding protein [Methylobacterium indicum]KTS14463.1 DNA-binding protein [Methylobacterium indicum]
MSKQAASRTSDDETTDHEETWQAFREAVNMSPGELEKWLDSEESRSVGWSDGAKKESAKGGESVGHHQGRRIVEIKHTKKADLTDDDYADMRKVAAYVKRHLAQGGPKEDAETSRWRYSLMNWGHDPLKD